MVVLWLPHEEVLFHLEKAETQRQFCLSDAAWKVGSDSQHISFLRQTFQHVATGQGREGEETQGKLPVVQSQLCFSSSSPQFALHLEMILHKTMQTTACLSVVFA